MNLKKYNLTVDELRFVALLAREAGVEARKISSAWPAHQRLRMARILQELGRELWFAGGSRGEEKSGYKNGYANN